MAHLPFPGASSKNKHPIDAEGLPRPKHLAYSD